MWASYLSALLKRHALEVFIRLSKDDQSDYSQIKEALLTNFDLFVIFLSEISSSTVAVTNFTCISSLSCSKSWVLAHEANLRSSLMRRKKAA